MASTRPAFNAGGVNVIVDTKKLDKIIKEMDARAFLVINKYGVAIAAETAMNAPKDTSALANSYLSESRMVDDLTFRIQDGVEYGIWQEFGTGRMAAQPHLIPAIEKWRDKFLKAFGDLFK